MIIVFSGNNDLSEEDLRPFSNFGANEIIRLHNEEEPLPIQPALVDLVICHWFFKYHHLKEFTKLKYIQLLSVGYNGIDIDLARIMGIRVFNAKDVYSIPISEFVVTRLLSYYKQDYFFLENQKKHNWLKNRDIEEIYGKQVLIIGTGSIGTEIAKRLRCFTDEVYGCNRTLKSISVFKEIFPLSKLQSIIKRFDIIIVSLALTESTYHLIDADAFRTMKSSSLLINVSRGAIINEIDLIEALNRQMIGGAILDVFEEEPLSNQSPLWNMDNVMLSPHNSFVSHNNSLRLKDVIYRNYKNWLEEYGEK